MTGAQNRAAAYGILTRKVTAMVDEVAPSARAHAAALAQQERQLAERPTTAEIYMQAMTDAVTLSNQARQVLRQIASQQTVAEAWLQHLTEPPDLTQPRVSAASSTAGGGTDGGDSGAVQAAMRQSLNRATANLSWLFDAMSPPKVDIGEVARALAQRMAADNVGVQPPVDQVVASADQTGTAAVMYVENLAVTAGHGTTTASVEHVALTTVDPSLLQGGDGGTRPLVLDVGGEAKKIPDSMMLPGEKKANGIKDSQPLLVVRQGGTTLPEGTLHVKLDLLLPIG